MKRGDDAYVNNVILGSDVEVEPPCLGAEVGAINTERIWVLDSRI